MRSDLSSQTAIGSPPEPRSAADCSINDITLNKTPKNTT